MNARIQSIESYMKCGSTVTGSGMANAPVLEKTRCLLLMSFQFLLLTNVIMDLM
jgi:hypothetical protein